MTYKMIMHNWNSYLVPVESLKSRPKSEDFYGYSRTDDMMKALSDADERWISRIEHYYVMPELLKEWGYEHGRGSKTKDLTKLFIDIDFIVTRTDTVQHVKIARGAPTVEMKNVPVAMPVGKIFLSHHSQIEK